VDYLLWGLVGGAIALVLFFLLTREKSKEVEGLMDRFGSTDDRKAWNRPSASVWDESRSRADEERKGD
jgi:hypothetical protein